MSTALSWGRRLLMCPPTHYDVTYAINPWMDLSADVDRDRAQRQWEELVSTLRAAGAEVELLDVDPALPDLVFTANLGVVAGRTFVPARMRHLERRPEALHAEAWFGAHGFDVRPLRETVVQEGAGDALPFADTLVAGYGPRSHADAYVELGQIVGGPILPITLVDARFYHLDIVFCPLDSDAALLSPDAIDPADLERVEELVADVIALTGEEAAAFCANSVAVGRTVVMPACTARLERELRARGFEPVVVDMSEFLKSGGGPRCLTLALDVPSRATR